MEQHGPVTQTGPPKGSTGQVAESDIYDCLVLVVVVGTVTRLRFHLDIK